MKQRNNQQRDGSDPAPKNPLTERVSISALQAMQDRFSALGQVSMSICTVDGCLLTAPSWGHDFARLIVTSPRGRQAFEGCIRRIAQNASSSVPSACLHGTLLYAARIRSGERTIALIVVGPRPQAPLDRSAVRSLAAEYGLAPDDLIHAAESVEPWTDTAQLATYRFADLLADTVAELYRQAELIERQLSDLRAVHELASLLAGVTELQEILDTTAQRVVEVMGVKACAIRLLDEATGELVIKSVCNLSQEYLSKGAVMLGENPIDTAAFGGETVYIRDAPTDPRSRYPEDARREGLASGLCVPMVYRGQTVGVLRVYTSRTHDFQDAERALLRSIGSQAASAVINTALAEQRVRAERVQRQLQRAGEIQGRMLPAKPPKHPVLDLGCVYAPTLEVGGDFYDFIDLPDGQLALCIADVVGKGMPAALLMASARSALRCYVHGPNDIGEIISLVNRHMERDTQVSEFATLLYGSFSTDGRRFTYCNAGHDPALLLRNDEFIELRTGGMVIGVLADAEFEHETVSLESGDILTFITDGVTDATNFDGERYGRARLTDSIVRHRALDAQQLASQLLWDVRRFVGLAEQADDITIVAVKVG